MKHFSYAMLALLLAIPAAHAADALCKYSHSDTQTGKPVFRYCTTDIASYLNTVASCHQQQKHAEDRTGVNADAATCASIDAMRASLKARYASNAALLLHIENAETTLKKGLTPQDLERIRGNGQFAGVLMLLLLFGVPTTIGAILYKVLGLIQQPKLRKICRTIIVVLTIMIVACVALGLHTLTQLRV